MKTALISVSEKIQKGIEFHLSPQGIQVFLCDALNFLKNNSQDLKIDQDRTHLQSLLFKMGWIDDDSFGLKGLEIPSLSLQEIEIWRSELQDGKVIHNNAISPGCGKMLEGLDSLGEHEWISDNMEALLRHVEVARRDSLNKFTFSLTKELTWLEKLDILILFCRYARRHQDLRFLNAALKTNEYWFKRLSNKNHLLRFARYTISLAEQEYCVKVMLR